ncbi:MAG TPA: hypothetical protein P5572_05910 [Phycisphaerae bacterium]|nr:hypothetical protein [Phycisphaerales bacterium]HRX84538.1 hypothetical protein [Phycisphaerae bacterium]
MLPVALIILLAVALSLTLAPLASLFIAWRRFGSCARRRGAWIVVYYGVFAAALVVHFWAIAANIAVTDPNVFTGLLAAQAVVSLLGPLLGAEVIRAAGAASPLCERCRYDLTGNTSGVCSECGREITKGRAATEGWWRSWRREAWPRVRIPWSIALLLVFLCLGVRERIECRYCPICASSQYTHGYALAIPKTGVQIFALPTHVAPQWGGPSALTSIVDPAGTCRHEWIDLGADVIGIGYGDLSQRDDPLYALDQLGGSVLRQYANTRPELIEQCRQDLRAGDACAALVAAVRQDSHASWMSQPWVQDKLAEWYGEVGTDGEFTILFDASGVSTERP